MSRTSTFHTGTAAERVAAIRANLAELPPGPLDDCGCCGSLQESFYETARDDLAWALDQIAELDALLGHSRV